MNLTLSLINLKLRPFSLVAYGEDHTPTLFGIQTPSKHAFITDLFSCWHQPWVPEMPFLSWSRTAQITDLPKSAVELQKIFEMAKKFKKYLPVSPIIWTTYEHKPKRGAPHQGFSGTAFFSTPLSRNVTTQPDHKKLFLMPEKDDIWTLNGTPISECTVVIMDPKNPTRISIADSKGETSYCFAY